jgi:hypothetical protein
MAMTKLAKPNIIINVSKIVKQQHPLSIGSMPTPPETPILCLSSISQNHIKEERTFAFFSGNILESPCDTDSGLSY